MPQSNQIVNPDGSPANPNPNAFPSLGPVARWLITALVGAIIFLFGHMSALERRMEAKYVTKSEYDAGRAELSQRVFDLRADSKDVRSDLRDIRTLLDTILPQIKRGQ